MFAGRTCCSRSARGWPEVRCRRQSSTSSESKFDGGVRGIVAGDVVRRLVARTMSQQLSPAVERATSPYQMTGDPLLYVCQAPGALIVCHRVGPFWVHFGSILGPFWVHFGSILGPCWVHVGSMLGPCWVQVGSMLGPCWVHVGSMLGPCWVHVGSMLGPCWVHVGSILGPFWVHFAYCLNVDAS